MVDFSEIEHLLSQSGFGLFSLFELLPDMVFVVDREERILFINKTAAQALGKKPEEFLGRTQSAFFEPELAARHSRSIQLVFRTGEVVVREEQQDLHLKPVWIDTRLIPFRGPDGDVLAVIGVIRDVTERRHAQEQLALREAFLSGILDNLPYLAWFKSTEGKFQVVNRPFAIATGKSDPSELLGLDDFAV